MISYTRAEMETSIVFDEDEKIAHIYTASPVTMRKLDKLCEQYPDEYKRVWTEGDAKVTAAKYTVPSKRIRYGKPANKARQSAARTAATYSPFLLAKDKH